MNRAINRWILILGVLAIAGSVMTGQVFAQAINVEAAKQEGKVDRVWSPGASGHETAPCGI